jgi:hypothetical protein
VNIRSEPRQAEPSSHGATSLSPWLGPSGALARAQRQSIWLATVAWLGLGAWLLWGGLVVAPGPHDNDWPLLMWLVKHASWRDPSSLAIGHYGPAQLLLAWWLYPLFGSTLVAAKVLSTLALLGCVACLYLMTRRDHGQAPALLAAAAFGLSASALQTGQSEFADAPALAALLAGLCSWWRAESGAGARGGLPAGVLLGSAGLLRTHFVFFSLGSALLAALCGVALPGERSRRVRAQAGFALVVGALLGNLPGFLLNLWVHGQLGSAVASSFVGQVLYGVDELDLVNTYAAHPLGQILREQPLDVLRLMVARGREQPALWLIPVASAALALGRWRVWPAAVLRHVLLFSALAFIYFWMFVSLAWWLWPRVLLPLVALDCWLLVSVNAQLFWGAFRHSRALCCLVFASVLALQWPGKLRDVQARWRESQGWWRASRELVFALRQRGMRDAREAFVFDWNRFVVDDPQLQPFYNFGFWNLLIPAFRDERPSPMRYMNDLPALSAFLENHGVRFLVLPKDTRQVARFPALVQLLEGTRELPSFHREADLASDVLFQLGV